jgi:hypothetical protein
MSQGDILGYEQLGSALLEVHKSQILQKTHEHKVTQRRRQKTQDSFPRKKVNGKSSL